MNPELGKDARFATPMRLQQALAVACLLCLAACSGGTSSGLTESRPQTHTSGNTLLDQVRAAGQVGNELDVQPLRDPQVEDLRASATQAESRGDFASAGGLIAQALLITPDDPDLLQWQAEIALVARDWASAEQLATRSYERGPRLGGLCRRNWMTIQLAAQARRDSAQALQAQQRVSTCTVAPPLRM
jgi:hypothetical protein